MDELREVTVTPGPVLDLPLRGRVRRLQPDPSRRRVRALGRAAVRRSCTACGRWRRSRGRRPTRSAIPLALKSLSVQFRGMGVPEQDIVITSKLKSSRRTARPSSTAKPSRTATSSSAADARFLESEFVLTPRQALLLSKVVDGFAQYRAAGGLEDARRRPGCDRRAVDDPQRARRARGARAAGASRTRRQGGCRRTRATATTSIACCPRRPSAGARAVAGAARGRRGDAGDDRDAVAGHEPAGDRHRAADRDDHDPPHRGPAPAAAGADGGRDHLHRRRLQEALHVRPAGGQRARGLGGRVPQRVAGRDGPGRADARLAARGPLAVDAGERAFLAELAPAFLDLADTAEDTLYVDGAHRLLSASTASRTCRS